DGDDLDGLHRGHRRPRRGALAARDPRHPGRGADGDVVRGADRRVQRDAAHPDPVQRHLPVPAHAAVHVLPDLLPHREPAGALPGPRLAVAAVAWRRSHPGPRPRDVRRSAAGHGDPRGRPGRHRRRRNVGRHDHDRAEVDPRMTTPTLPLRVAPPLLFGSRRSLRLLARNLYFYRHTGLVIVSGFFEPLFYLLSIGFGLGRLVGTVPGPGGADIPYALFVAPALLASSSMNGAITEATLNFFFKLRYQKTFDAILSTPLSAADIAVGEMGWGLIRGA